ncbi:MAG: hypothetical protein L3J82_00735 [Planctomycetes bacterium]|nr:hypothetical protein [Planctomycetota bacterium]
MNIIVVAYLAFAPGMDVSQLLKSVGLCEFFETQIHSDHCDHSENHVNHFHSNHCLHNHGQQPDGQDSNDSNTEDTDHHHHNIVVETSVMAATASVAVSAPIVAFYTSQQLPKAYNVVERLRQQSPRAPPWARQSLTVKLIV